MAGAIDFKPDIIHANDWQTGLASVYLRDKLARYVFYTNTQSLFTIHNLQYQGVFGRSVLADLDLDDGYFSMGGLEFFNNISLLKSGIAHSSAVSTVSETYAHEITTPEYGFSMDGVIRSRKPDLYGIVNGIDYDRNNPEKDRFIYTRFGIDSAVEGKAANKAELQKEMNMPQRPDAPLFGIISRLTDQKGLDILSIIMDEFLNRDVQLVVLGQGDGRYEQMFNYFRWKYPDKCYIYLGFNNTLAQKIYASTDFFLMPSLFEPCGLGQLTAMRYGSLPIVRNTGGLADTVQHFNRNSMTGNGFRFDDYLASGLMWAINEALSVYENSDMMAAAVKNAMSCDYSWDSSARKYIELYKKIIKKAQ
jgi:starch synthase